MVESCDKWAYFQSNHWKSTIALSCTGYVGAGHSHPHTARLC